MAIGKATLPLLQAAEQKIQESVKPQFRQVFEQVTHAGLSIMYSPALQATMMRHLTNVAHPEQEAGVGAARLLGELQKQAKGKIPAQVVMPAAIIFICEYFDLLAKVGHVQVTPDMLAQAARVAGETLLKASGITEQDIQGAIQKHAPDQVQPSAAPPAGGIINSQMQGA